MRREEVAGWRDRPLSYWQELWGVPRLRVFRAVGSTSDVAREMAEADAAHGTLVLAREQTRGRGRRGRRWEAPPDSSLLLSMVLRPPEPAAARVLSLRLGMAAARAIESVARLPVRLKWPNDLLVEGRKVAGILCEGSFEAGRLHYTVAGIGVNLHQKDDDWPPDLAGEATSLDAEAGAPVDDARLAGRIVAEWLAVASSARPALDAGEIERFRQRDALRGRLVAVDGRPAGTAAGISPEGALIVLDGGREKHVRSGTVRSAPNLTEEQP